ncbi:MAG: CPBP family intramembrane metalloprotease [Pirellulaceae bacterium]|nr:CPBP family intramembrane metalloprotease [Pirellulaceae bacterium]
MNWRHVHLIYLREMRDQLRDRRTLFTITVLPLLLYPLLGMLMMQVAQFKRDQSVRVRVVGIEHWPKDAGLVETTQSLDGFARLTAELEREIGSESVEIHPDAWPVDGSVDHVVTLARQSLTTSDFDAILIVEPEFEKLLADRRAKVKDLPPQPSSDPPESSNSSTTSSTATSEDVLSSGVETDSPGLQVVANMARDRSQLAVRRLQNVLRVWQQRWVSQELSAAGINPVLVEPLAVKQNDTSETSMRRAMLWAKILPFIMLVWALTGAFYPAIDLCAGEKERGTLETLLSSPARRREIVWGKLFTVATFSMLSALLNLLSMHMTAGFIVEQLASQGTPQLAEAFGRLPIHAFGWLVLLLVPMSAFFSALALAVAALARSTKEGQYYLMPLLLFTLPLVTMPMIPSLDLTLATSMVPVSGAIFLVRALIEGRITEACIHLPVVFGVTAICCLLAIRWAVRQFESESVMFSESERWNLQSWIRQVWRDRGAVASPSEATLCGLIILVAMFFSQFIAGPSTLAWETLAQRAVVTQIGLILTPCLLMAIFLTRSMRQALRIHPVPIDQIAAAIVLALALHPSYVLLGQAIAGTIQIGTETQRVLETVARLINAQPLWAVLLVLAVLPAVCEELTYRGFIFGGLLRNNGVLRAVLMSSLFFGLAHSFLQQSIAATLMGVLLGVIAWRTGSVVCTMLIHVINNSLSVSLGWISDRQVALPEAAEWFISIDQGQWHYQPAWITFSVVLSLAMLAILWRRTPAAERLAEAELV